MLNNLKKKEKETLLKQGAKFLQDDLKFINENRDFRDNPSFRNLEKVLDGEIDFLETVNFRELSKIQKIWYENLIIANDILLQAPFEILKKLNDRSKKSYFVGGVNRDCIADKAPKDFDVVTDLPVDEIKDILSEICTFKDVGEHFQVVLATHKRTKEDFEIAQFRKDLDHKGQGATNVEVGTFEDDWQRRDFTMNALYSNPFIGEYLDPSGFGVEDAVEKRIRFVGNAKERIEEDSIRLLRCLKFHKKGFKMTSGTLRSFRQHFPLLLKSHPERIREHLELLVDL